MERPLGRWRDAIFFASGFAGLVYESIWTQYLKLFLGHAAYAQTLVLAMFMGGMAIGAAVAARGSARLARPLVAYAAIEAAIGLLALVFHPIFVAATGGLHELAFASQLWGAPFAALKLGLAALLILPQTVLLGATFPVFGAAATRAAPAAAGRSIAMLYCANSLGGAAGALVSGFVLVGALGLPGTIAAAGAVNLAVAALVYALARNEPGSSAARAAEAPTAVSAPAGAPAAVRTPTTGAASAGRIPPKHAAKAAAKARAAAAQTAARAARDTALPAPETPAPAAAPAPAPDVRAVARWLLAASFLTGASSFVYEIGWIRMLSLVLGSATHSFELMLSSFVLGLGLGGFWIRTRIDGGAGRGALLAWIQVAMGFAALATVPLHNLSFDLMAQVLAAVERTDAGYTTFNLARYGIASLIMFPAAFCAGMTLPLATQLLYAQGGEGERAIGRIYAFNTLGSIAGLAFAVHVGLPLVGLEHLVAVGALVDVALGAALLVVFRGRAQWKKALVAVVACTAGGAAAAMSFDPQKLVSGVFRSGRASAPARVVEIAHGKTATVSVERSGDNVTLRVNGKADASANVGGTAGYPPDLVTQRLLGAIPLLLHDAPRSVANIGLGSGITGATILADPRVRSLDTVEIEPQVVALARHFAPRNTAVYEDPRSAIHVDDAKSFFATRGATYDVIVSEPSNPWVSGVASLFSVEFYRQVSRHLNAGGLFAQWLQTYETNPDRVTSVLKAMGAAFDDYLALVLVDGDVLLVGRRHGALAMPADPYARLAPAQREMLRAIDVVGSADLVFRVIGNKALFQPWLDARPIAANSDFAPYLDVNADRDRFLRRGWPEFDQLALSPLPVQEIMGARPPLPTPSALSVTQQLGPLPPWLAARQVKEMLVGPPPPGTALPIPPDLPARLAGQGSALLDRCAQPPADDPTAPAATLAARVLPFLSPAEGRGVLAALRRAPCLAVPVGGTAPWPALLEHVANRDARGIAATATAMLGHPADLGRLARGYLVGAATLGHLGAGDRAAARAVWQRHAAATFGGEPPVLVLDILRDHALQ